MDLKIFKKLYKRFNKFPLPKQEWQTIEYQQYQEALYSNDDCRNWYLLQQIREAGIDYKRFCCVSMAFHLIEDKLRNTEDNVNRIMTYNRRKKAFGIPIHDGGASFISIAYCPWCGRDLSNYPISRPK